MTTNEEDEGWGDWKPVPWLKDWLVIERKHPDGRIERLETAQQFADYLNAHHNAPNGGRERELREALAAICDELTQGGKKPDLAYINAFLVTKARALLDAAPAPAQAQADRAALAVELVDWAENHGDWFSFNGTNSANGEPLSDDPGWQELVAMARALVAQAETP